MGFVYSYVINIFGLSTSCPLPPPLMQRAMPLGETMMPFCEGEYWPRTTGRFSLFITLLPHNNGYGCSLPQGW